MDNNEQSSPVPQQSEQNSVLPPKRVGGKVIGVVGLVAVVVIAIYTVVTWKSGFQPEVANNANDQVSAQPTTPIAAAPTQEKMYDLTTALSLVPTSWGQMTKSDVYSNYKDRTDTLHTLQFANDVSAVFQDGVGLIAYSKIKEQNKCVNYNKKFGTSYDYGDNEICYITENGIYNFETKQFVVLNKDSTFSSMSAIEVAPFQVVDGSGQRTTAIFSPKGTYFSYAAPIYEGCAMTIINTTTGEAIHNQSKEDRYIDNAFSCDPVIDFSEDEKTFTLRVVWWGMMSPGTQFSVVQGSTQFDILSKLIKKQFDFLAEEVNPVGDFKVTSVTDSEVKFEVLQTNSYYTKGSYTFNLGTNKISQP